MKIMQLNIVYGEGSSTGKIVYDLHEIYKNTQESYVIYGHGSRVLDSQVFKTSNLFLNKLNAIYTRLTGFMYKGSFLGTYNTIQKIKKIKPDVVHIHVINGHMLNIYMLIEFLKKNNVRLVLTHHGEFFYTGSYTHVPDGSSQWITGENEKYPEAKILTNSWIFNKTYPAIKKMRKAFNDYENMVVTSVSPWVNERSKKSFVFKDKYHQTVLNGIDTQNIFYRRDYDDIFKKHNLGNEKIILHVTSGFSNPIKGSKYMLEMATRLPNIKFIFIGLKDNTIELPNNCINVGMVKDGEILAKYYSMADLTVITSKKETFSMIVAESLCCGTPIVGFKAGGPETITIPEYSDFVEFGDIDALVEKTKYWLNREVDSQKISNEAVKKYDKTIMAESYIKIYKSLIKKQKIQ